MLSQDFAERLPSGVSLSPSGHRIVAFDSAGADVTDDLFEASSLAVVGTALEVIAKETGATPTLAGTFRFRMFARTTQPGEIIEEGVLAFLLVRRD